jgi:hypothetical protein
MKRGKIKDDVISNTERGKFFYRYDAYGYHFTCVPHIKRPTKEYKGDNYRVIYKINEIVRLSIFIMSLSTPPVT